MKIVIGIVLLFVGLSAQAQLQEGCLPLTQTSSAPLTVTMWCSVIDYSGQSPLSPSYTTEFITLQQGVNGENLHLQLDNWFSSMDVTFQLEFLHGSRDIVTIPFFVQYDGVDTFVADFPLVVHLNAGDRLRISQQAFIPHPCQISDNCGLHALFTFQ